MGTRADTHWYVDSPVGWTSAQVKEGLKTTGNFLPVLAWVCDQIEGPIVEFGVGFYSTPYLASLGREFVSVESDPAWREFAGRHFSHLVVGDLTELTSYEDMDWGVVFLDQDPVEERIPTLKNLPFQAAVIHDLPKANWVETFDEYEYKDGFDQTTVLAHRELK